MGITDLTLDNVQSIALGAFYIFSCSVLAANLPDRGSWVGFPKKLELRQARFLPQVSGVGICVQEDILKLRIKMKEEMYFKFMLL